MNGFVGTEEFVSAISKYDVIDIFINLYWKKSAKYRKFEKSMYKAGEYKPMTLDQFGHDLIEFINGEIGHIIPIETQEMYMALNGIEDFFDEVERRDSEDTIRFSEWASTWDKRHDKIVLYPLMKWVNLIVKNSKRCKVA